MADPSDAAWLFALASCIADVDRTTNQFSLGHSFPRAAQLKLLMVIRAISWQFGTCQ